MKKAALILISLLFTASITSGQTGSKSIIDILMEYPHRSAIALNGLVMVCKEDTEHCGCIDTLGNEVIPFIYGMNFFYFMNEPPIFNSVNRMVAAKPLTVTQAVYGIIDEKGNTILPFEYKTDYHNFHPLDAYHVFKTYNEPHIYGVVDSLGNIAIPFKYDKIEKAGRRNFIIKKNNRYGLLNTKGEHILPLEYDKILYNGTYNLVFIEKDKKWGAYTTMGKEILPIQYKSVNFTANNHLITSTENKMEFFTPEAKLIKSFDVDFGLEQAESQTTFPIVLRNKNKDGVINASLEIVVPFEYDYISLPPYFAYPNDSILYVKKDGKEAFIDTSNNLLSNMWFDSVSYFGLVKKDDLWGWVNLKGELQIPVKYENLKVMRLSGRHYPINQKQEFYFITTKNGQTALFDYDSKWLLSYDDGIEEIHSVYRPEKLEKVYVIYKKNGKYGVADTNNKTVIPFEYDSVESDFMLYERFKMGHYRFHKGKKRFLVDWDKEEMVKE
jgi:hypothetical protein